MKQLRISAWGVQNPVPVSLLFIALIVAGLFAYGTAKWPTPGPWAMSAGVYKLVTVLSVVGMGVILFIAVAPPNDRVLTIVVGFIVLALAVWVLIENRRFQGPPVGDAVKARAAAIAAAEKAIGQK